MKRKSKERSYCALCNKDLQANADACSFCGQKVSKHPTVAQFCKNFFVGYVVLACIGGVLLQCSQSAQEPTPSASEQAQPPPSGIGVTPKPVPEISRQIDGNNKVHKKRKKSEKKTKVTQSDGTDTSSVKDEVRP